MRVFLSIMIYYQNGSTENDLTHSDLQEGLFEAFKKMGVKRKVLTVPPDYTRFQSRSGELTEIAWKYYGEKLTDILPA